MKEEDLYDPVNRAMVSKGYEVYPEVVCKYVGTRADILCLKTDTTCVVELKTSLSIELLGQAVKWKNHANLIYVAVPLPAKHFHWYALRLLEQEGIGLLSVSEFGRVHEHLGPIRNTIVSKYLRDSITPLHKSVDIKGGHCGGGYLTPYRATMIGVQEFLTKNNKWTTVDEIAINCKNHYHNAKQSLPKALKDFEADWCEHKVINRKLHFRVRRGAK